MAKNTPPGKGKAKEKRARRTSLFPAASFEESLTIAKAIQKYAAGRQVRRLTLFDQMNKSPDSGPSRQLVTNSNRYGLTKGSYKSEYLELSPEGRIATGAEVDPGERLRVSFRLAIENTEVFKAVYDALKGNRLPAISVLEDLAKENGVPAEDARECVEMFIVNAKFLGILKPIAGAERVVPIEQAVEELPSTPGVAEQVVTLGSDSVDEPGNQVPAKQDDREWNDVCFYISPIGEDETETQETRRPLSRFDR